MKLTIELVPSTSWYSNVRSNVTKKEWDTIRKKSYKLADYKCEICKDNGKNQGFRHPVECHEIWDYNDKTKVQKLTGLVSLCPLCHKTKHIGLAFIQNQATRVTNHLMKVNSVSFSEAEKYISESFVTFEARSSYNWEVDISYLEKYLKE